LGLVAYVGFGYYQLHSVPAPDSTVAAIPIANGSVSPAATALPASATPIPAPTAVRPARRDLGVKLTQLSWLRVNVDGHVVLEGEFPPGTVRDFRGKHVKLLVGNAGGVEVSAPGQPERVLGSIGQVVERDYTLPGKVK